MTEFTVGDLRAVISELPDDTRVVIDSETFFGYPTDCWVQASDAVPKPFGSDPMSEATVGVVLIEAYEPAEPPSEVRTP